MAFFDDIGRKISQAGQSAVQKTKDMTEIAKYNSAISDEQAKINAYYSEIGKLYFSLNREAPDERFAPMVNGIAVAESAIEDYREKIKDIKGIVQCSACGAQLTGGAFCSACGAAVPVEEPTKPEQNANSCSACGAAVAPGMAFCSSCGAPAAAKESAVAEKSAFCAECGAPLAENTAFCTSCGARRA